MADFLRRKWWMMALGALVGAAAGYSATLVIRPGYRAQCLIEPAESVDSGALAVKLLRPSLLRSVSDKLSRDKTFSGSRLDVGKSLSATMAEGGLVRLRCKGPEPLVCERVLDLVLDEYRGGLLERSSKEDEEEVRLIRDRISEYRRCADEKEEELGDFMKKYSWLADYGAGEQGIAATYEKRERIHADNAREVARLEKELEEAKKKKERIKANLDGEQEHVVTEMVKEVNPDIIDLNQELLAKQKELRQYLVDSSEGHPMVKRLRKEIESIERMIDQKPKEIIKEQKVSVNPMHRKLKGDLFAAENDVEKTEARLAKLREAVEQHKRAESEIPSGEWQRIIELDKERSRNLDLMESLKGRLSAALERDRGREIDAVEFGVIDPPTSREVAPEKRVIVSVAALIGLFLGAAVPSRGKRSGT